MTLATQKQQKIKIRYISNMERYFPGLGRKFPGPNPEDNEILINLSDLDVYLRMSSGPNRLWQKVEPVEQVKETEEPPTTEEII